MSIGRVPGITGIQPSIVDAKGDLIVATAADSVSRLAVGTNEQRLVADSAAATGLKYVADTTNYAIAAKGDLLVGTGADTLAALTVGTNGHTLVADSATATGLKWAAPAGFGTLTAYTPTLTGITIGNGTFSDVGYSESGDAVWYYGMFSYGSTSSSSGAGVQISLPVNADPTASNISGRSPAWNFAGVADTSTGYYYPLMAAAQNATPSTKLDLYRLLANATNLYNDATPMDGNTNPIALGSGDTIWWNFIYKKA